MVDVILDIPQSSYNIVIRGKSIVISRTMIYECVVTIIKIVAGTNINICSRLAMEWNLPGGREGEPQHVTLSSESVS